ncbi:MAG: hypothetical protein HY825_20420 [Acidobacteria bacterium]|nr:hypothetical protein [Acidobacteriota bacterium]
MDTHGEKHFGLVALLAASAVAGACGGLSLAGNPDDDAEDGDADGEGGIDAVDAVDIASDVPAEDAGDAPPEDAAVPDEVTGEDDALPDDADASGSEIVGLEPEGTEEYIVPVGGETIRPHRHAVPAALGDGVYAIVADVETGADGLRIGLYLFDREVRELRQVWLDEPGSTTEYNSVCWTGEAFVAALPTSRVGLRVLSVGADGALLRDPMALEADATYSPAGAGQPPVVLCGGEGPFVIDHGRGAGGADRVYALAPDGTYGGGFVDVDLPAFSTTTYYASTPCTAAGTEVACATPNELVFVRRDGSHRLSDPVAAPGICPPGMSCDVTRTSDGLAVAWSALGTDSLTLTFARFGFGGALDRPPVAGPAVQATLRAAIRVANSGETVLVSAPPSDPDPLAPVYVYLFDTSGVPIGVPLVAGLCSGHEPGAPDCPFPMGGSSATPVFWEGDAYAALWIPEGPWALGALAYRRFRLIDR